MRRVGLCVPWLLCLACDPASTGGGEAESMPIGTEGDADDDEADDDDADDDDADDDADADSTDGDDADGADSGDAGDDSTTGAGTTSGPEGTSGEDPSAGDDDGSTGAGDDPLAELPPDDAAALEAWLQAGSYAGWNAESGPHPSAGPHFGNVRTFLNDPLYGSMQGAGAQTVHPIGAAVVKELYGPGSEVRGWAVLAKRPQDGGEWAWFEVYDGDVLADGVGLGICENCHGVGLDQVLTPFPLQ